MLTGRPLLALVDVLAAIHPLVAAGAWARVRAVDGTSVTDCVGVARVRRAGVVQVAQQPCDTSALWNGPGEEILD
jgi:hypothetical protein